MRLRHRPFRSPSPQSPRSSGPAARSSARGGRVAAPRPSLLLWRHRHLVVALCLGTAVLAALSVLRPGPERGQQVLITARQVTAGALITEQDLSTSRLPTSALPQAGLASKEQVVGSRAAVTLEPGTVLTVSMTSGGMAQQLGADERLVQVPIEVGAELARPGARVDIIGQTREGWTPQTSPQPASQEQEGAPEGGSEGQVGSPTQIGPENNPGKAPSTPPESPPDQKSPGIQQTPQSLSQEMSTGPLGERSTVLCSGARVVMTQRVGDDDHWTGNKKVTLITLAIPAGNAILVVGAATSSTLGIVLSP
mgnify:FL=1